MMPTENEEVVIVKDDKLDNVVSELIEKLRDILDFMHSPTNEELLDLIEETVIEYGKEHTLHTNEMKKVIDRIYHSFRGLGVLQPLLDDASVTEIMINDYNEIFIEQAGQVFQTDIKFESRQRLEDTIQSIVSKVNRVVNESSPIVDARLEDGSRVNVVLPPVALKGPAMTIRKFPSKPITIDDLIGFGAISEEAARFLEHLVQAKYNVFISGGTGSGKTTFLNVLSNFVPVEERIITIEDSAELQIQQVPNLVSMETRNKNTEGKGEVSIRDLIKSSLRMRPNRIIVGEVRGAEALDMLQAMNTGHDGSLSTGHANSIVDMLSRMETMVLSGAELPIEVIRNQISSAVDIMVHLTRFRDHSRKIVQISEVLGMEDGKVKLSNLFEFRETGEDAKGKVLGGLERTENKFQSISKLQLAGKSDVLEEMNSEDRE